MELLDDAFARGVLDKARKRGATSGDVLIVEGDHFTGRVRLAKIDQVTEAREKHLGLRLFFEKRSASTSTSDLSPESLDRLIEDTCDLARATAFDDYAGLPEEGVFHPLPDLDLYDPDGLGLTVEERLVLATRTESSAFAADKRITNSEGAEFSNYAGRILYANTQGFSGNYRSTSYSLSVTPIASDGKGMQQDSWFTHTRRFSQMDSPETVGQIAAQRALRKIGGRKIATCQVPVVFDPDAASSLLSNLFSALSGYSIYKGASFLLGDLEKSVASDIFSVYDDGTIPGGLGSKPFDGEGTPTHKTVVVDRGVLRNYLLDTYSARKLGLHTTGNASRGIGGPPSVSPTNFYLAPGSTPPEEIIRSVSSGLYVTDLIGFGFNPVTGDYSRGASGIWIENGELTYPVEEITIAGNLREMLRDVETIGSDLRLIRKISAPTLKISRMTIAGS